MKIIYSDKFLDKISIFMKVGGITLYPFIILRENYKKDTKESREIINHEKIHIEQQKELFVIFFYILYLIEYIFKGYYNISFEKEAYENDNNLEYLKTRKRYSFLKYFKKTN